MRAAYERFRCECGEDFIMIPHATTGKPAPITIATRDVPAIERALAAGDAGDGFAPQQVASWTCPSRTACVSVGRRRCDRTFTAAHADILAGPGVWRLCPVRRDPDPAPSAAIPPAGDAWRGRRRDTLARAPGVGKCGWIRHSRQNNERPSTGWS